MSALDIKVSPSTSPNERATVSLNERLYINLESAAGEDTWWFFIHRRGDAGGILLSGGDHVSAEEAHAAALAELAVLRDELLTILPRPS